MFNLKRTSIIVLLLIGFGLSVELCRIYYNANFNPYALDSFCSINNLIDCDGVAKTNFAQFAGIPLCLWGIFFYSFSLLLLASPALSTFEVLRSFQKPDFIRILLVFTGFCIFYVLSVHINFCNQKNLCTLLRNILCRPRSRACGKTLQRTLVLRNQTIF